MFIFLDCHDIFPLHKDVKLFSNNLTTVIAINREPVNRFKLGYSMSTLKECKRQNREINCHSPSLKLMGEEVSETNLIDLKKKREKLIGLDHNQIKRGRYDPTWLEGQREQCCHYSLSSITGLTNLILITMLPGGLIPGIIIPA